MCKKTWRKEAIASTVHSSKTMVAGSVHNKSPSMFPVFTNSPNDSLSESQIS